MSTMETPELRALLNRLKLHYHGNVDDMAHRLGDLLNIPKPDAARLIVKYIPSVRYTIDNLLSKRNAKDDDCTWVTIRGSPICIRDRDGDGKGDLPDFGGGKGGGPPKAKEPSGAGDDKGGKKPADYTTAFQNHSKFAESNKDLIGYSFDPTSNKGYSALDKDGNAITEVTKDIHKQYSDGESKLYFVGVTNHQGGLSRENESAYTQVANDGKNPMVGYFRSQIEYTDISFPVDHGTSDADVIKMLDHNVQESAMVVDKNGNVEFLRGSNVPVPKGGSAPFQ